MFLKKQLLPIIFLFLTSCLGYPETVKPVEDFQLQNFLGKWFEIARLDHNFELGLDNVTAEYSIREDGGIEVRNRGFSQQKDQWKEAIGKAYFVEKSTLGYLKVSFFGPFYGSYVIFELDAEAYAFACGSDMSYLWLLSRKPTISETLKKDFVIKIDQLGFNANELIWVNQAKNDSK